MVEKALTPSASAGDEEAGEQGERRYVFRGDDHYRGGPLGRALGAEADAADIQNPADHVLRKETRRSSRYVSFTTETKIARRFTSADDNRYVRKATMAQLRELESRGTVRLWTPDQVREALSQGPRKLARQAADVKAAMIKNREILIEGQIPGDVLERVH